MIKNETHEVCRICGTGSKVRPIGWTFKNIILYQCLTCTTTMVEIKHPPGQTTKIYNDLFESGYYEQHRKEFELLSSGKMPRNIHRSLMLRKFESRKRGRSLIEIGGGTGAFGVLVRSRGWDYINYDISDVAVECCRKLKLKSNFYTPNVPPPLIENTADIVVMWEVLEHVYNLSEYLDAIRKSLKPEGVFIFSTPNYHKYLENRTLDKLGSLSSPPIHINFFTKKSLERVLRLKGFTEQQISFKYVSLLPRPLKSISHIMDLMLENHSPTLYGYAK